LPLLASFACDPQESASFLSAPLFYRFFLCSSNESALPLLASFACYPKVSASFLSAPLLFRFFFRALPTGFFRMRSFQIYFHFIGLFCVRSSRIRFLFIRSSPISLFLLVLFYRIRLASTGFFACILKYPLPFYMLLSFIASSFVLFLLASFACGPFRSASISLASFAFDPPESTSILCAPSRSVYVA
jgi:hypothetical protein